ncbi:MAG: glycoside hydrolase family 92 protein [Muribaculaceae bacterium]|nr:glycoside hydrolase family 92 protein [Muribaculaceae bacterium]
MRLYPLFFALALSLIFPLSLSAKKPTEYLTMPLYEATPWGLSRLSGNVISNAIGIYSPDRDVYEQVSATPRGAIMEFVFLRSSNSSLKFDFASHDEGFSSHQRVKWVSDKAFKGWIKFKSLDGQRPANTIYFYCELSKKPSRRVFSTANGKIDSAIETEGDDVNLICEFSTTENNVITVKTAISHTSIPGAMSNFREDFATQQSVAQFQADAIGLWDNELNRIMVEGGSKNDKAEFYSSLYKLMLEPRAATDIDGQYRGSDHRDHSSLSYTHRNIYCSPDQANTLFPLLTIINPAVARDAMNTIIATARENRSNSFSDGSFLLTGSHISPGIASISLLTDCVMKGLFPRNLPRALAYAENTAKQLPPSTSPAEKEHIEWCLLQLAKTVGDSAAIQRHSAFESLDINTEQYRGNDAAAFVLSACGLRPLASGRAAYEITAPLFDQIIINFPSNYFTAKTFTISVDRANPGDNMVSYVTFNGKPLKSAILTHKELSQGGELHITLVGTKNMK